MASVRALVRVRPVGEIKGDDPAAVVTQVQAALGRGDVGAAMADYAKLPNSSRAASADWAKDAQGFARKNGGGGDHRDFAEPPRGGERMIARGRVKSFVETRCFAC